MLEIQEWSVHIVPFRRRESTRRLTWVGRSLEVMRVINSVSKTGSIACPPNLHPSQQPALYSLFHLPCTQQTLQTLPKIPQNHPNDRLRRQTRHRPPENPRPPYPSHRSPRKQSPSTRAEHSHPHSQNTICNCRNRQEGRDRRSATSSPRRP